MSIQIRNSRSVEIDLTLTYKFIGATVEGDYPPIGMEYKRFAFEPEPGSQGTLVFWTTTIQHYGFFQFYWKDDGKLVVSEGRIARRAYDFSETEELGYFVRANGMIYATGAPSVAPSGHPMVKQVDIINFFKYVEGKIDAQMLDQKARLLELRQRRTERLEETIRTLRGELGQADERMERAEKELRALTSLWFWTSQVFCPNGKLRPRLERWLLRRRAARAYDAVMAGLGNDSLATQATMRVISNEIVRTSS